MQYINIPPPIITRMNQYQRNFLWGTTTTRKKIHLLKWDIITPSKELGGLGIQNLEIKSAALLAKLAWRIFKSPKALWAQLLLNKYLTRKKAFKYSRIWSNILQGWEQCQNGLKWKIGIGQHINFWDDPWLHAGITIRSLIQGPLPSNQKNIKVSSFLNKDGWD